MNIAKWTARVSNWKKQDAQQKPLEYHISHLHEEVTEVFKELRKIYKSDSANHPMVYSAIYAGERDENGNIHPEGFGIELADVVLVALFIASVTGINLEEMMERKMAYNESRRAR